MTINQIVDVLKEYCIRFTIREYVKDKIVFLYLPTDKVSDPVIKHLILDLVFSAGVKLIVEPLPWYSNRIKKIKIKILD